MVRPQKTAGMASCRAWHPRILFERMTCLILRTGYNSSESHLTNIGIACHASQGEALQEPVACSGTSSLTSGVR